MISVMQSEIAESSHDNEFTMQMLHKTRGLMDWWINQKQLSDHYIGLVYVIIKSKNKKCFIKI